MDKEKPSTSDSPRDVVVVGGGPAGLSAALVLGRQLRTVTLVDSSQYRNAPATESHMYLGSDGASPQDIRERGREELAALPTVTVHTSEILGVTSENGLFVFRCGDGTEISSRAVVLATGHRDLPSNIRGVAQRFGRSIVHCPFCHGYETRGRSIAVLADNPAVAAQPAMQALYLRTHYSDDVALCTGGTEIPEALREVLSDHAIAILDAPISSVTGESGALTIEFSDAPSLSREAIFYVPRYEARSTLATDLGCENDGPYTLVDHCQRTSVAGVYAAGDIAKIRGADVPLSFISQAVAAGQAAALWCDQDLFIAENHLQSVLTPSK
ncbi:MAG: NAD(P)/FAD-dependent oxidoreductase [Rhodococcus sp.]|nr:NAD(P)/FAD-dependent oxidoreductase [Rhodococcus sp. (in: high G+C Gram-positive bacteria)]